MSMVCPERDDADNAIPYTLVPHTGDLAMRVWGRDLAELFVNAARALFAVMSTPPWEVSVVRRIDLAAMDTEALLVDWLNALIFLHETEGETYTTFVWEEFSPTHLTACVSGGPTVEKSIVVKAATYHGLQITVTDSGMEASIVYDI